MTDYSNLDRNPDIVALVYADDGTIYDGTYNWESAQSYALSEGLRVIAIRDDGHMKRDDIQDLCDAELDRHDDCYGVNAILLRKPIAMSRVA